MVKMNYEVFTQTEIDAFMRQDAIEMAQAGRLMGFVIVDIGPRFGTSDAVKIIEAWKQHFRKMRSPFIVTMDEENKTIVLWKQRIATDAKG